MGGRQRNAMKQSWDTRRRVILRHEISVPPLSMLTSKASVAAASRAGGHQTRQMSSTNIFAARRYEKTRLVCTGVARRSRMCVFGGGFVDGSGQAPGSTVSAASLIGFTLVNDSIPVKSR